VDTFDLRLYTMGLASLAVTLLLAAAVAAVTRAPRRVLAVLGLNALFHLLLDATEVKFGNGVHLLAPLSWRMTSFDLIAGESLVYLALSIGGALLVAWEIAREHRTGAVFDLHPRRLASAATLVAAYLVAPLPFLAPSGLRQLLGEDAARAGRAAGPGREPRPHCVPRDSGGRARRTLDGRAGASHGLAADHDASVSLYGTFLETDVLRVDRFVEHRRNRDWPSYLGLLLLALVFLRGALGPRALPSASPGA
jgi:hypothetical protein